MLHAYSGRIKDVHRCWDRIASLQRAHIEPELPGALAALGDLVKAQNAFWLGVVRLSTAPGDPLQGWRPRALVYLKPNDIDLNFAKKVTRGYDAGQVDESSRTNTREAGVFRARLQKEIVPAEWFGSPYHQAAYVARDIRDVVYVVTPVSRDAESYFGFHRKGRHRPFTTADRDLLAHAVRPLLMFQRQLMLGYGLFVASKPLTPAERRVLSCLLTGRSEKEIAATLSLTVRSTHAYVTELFRKFGVSSRAGLMALWLGGPK